MEVKYWLPMVESDFIRKEVQRTSCGFRNVLGFAAGVIWINIICLHLLNYILKTCAFHCV